MIYFIGLAIGILLGLTGAGGSVFAVPLLVFFLKLPASEAMGMALGAVAASATYGTVLQHKLVMWTPALILAAGGMIMAPTGNILASRIDNTVLLGGFSILAMAIAIRMWIQASSQPEETRHVRAEPFGSVDEKKEALLCRLSPTGVFQLRPRCISGLFIGGLAIGFLAGLFGVGGGFLIVPFLLFLSQLSMRAAIATSLFTIVLVSTSAFISHLIIVDTFDYQTLIKIILSGIGGMVISQTLSKKITGPVLQKTFAMLLIGVSLLTLVSH